MNMEWGEFQKKLCVVSSISMLVMDKILVAIVVPLIADWDWALTTNTVSNTTPLNETDITKNFTLIQPQLKASSELASIFIGCSVLELISTFTSGILVESIGLDFAALVGLLFSGMSCVLYGISSDFSGIIAAKISQGISSPILISAAFARINECLKDNLVATKKGNDFRYCGKHVCFSWSSFCWNNISIHWNFSMFYDVTFTRYHHTPCSHWQCSSCRPQKALSGIDEQHENQSVKTLLQFLLKLIKDYQIVIIILTMTVAWLPRAFLEPILSIWMTTKFKSGPAVVGTVWGSAGIAVILSSVITARFVELKPNFLWLYGLSHTLVTGILISLLPLSPNPVIVSVLFTLYGYSAMCSRNCLICIFKDIIDCRYDGYYALATSVLCFGFTLPYLLEPISIPIFNELGFQYMCILVGFMISLCSPLLLCVRKIISQNISEKEQLMKDVP